MCIIANYLQFQKVAVQTLKLLQFTVLISSVLTVLYLYMVIIHVIFFCCEQFGESYDDVLTTHDSVNSSILTIGYHHHHHHHHQQQQQQQQQEDVKSSF